MTASCREGDSSAAGAAPVAVVVAHPDDEALWLSSVVGRPIGLCSVSATRSTEPRRSAARRQAVAALPLAGIVDLGLPESGARLAGRLGAPRPRRPASRSRDAAARARYEANFPRLVAALRPALAGCREVYTHNPWGEYGHTEHIQVYRAVAALQDELGYTVWFANYVGAASWPWPGSWARLPCWAERRTVTPDLATGRRPCAIYRRYGAWTWTRWHRWPAHETLYAQPPAGDPSARHPLSGEWLLGCRGAAMVAAAMARCPAAAGLTSPEAARAGYPTGGEGWRPLPQAAPRSGCGGDA